MNDGSALTGVIALAASFAAEKHSALIRMEHLLLALSQCDGIAATALNSVGASPKRIREILDRMSG